MSVHVAETLIDDGDALVRSARYDEAVACYERVVERFGEADERDVRKQVMRALAGKGAALLDLERFGEADAVAEAMRERLSDVDPELALARSHALIANRRVATSSKAGRHEQAIAAADELLRRLAAPVPSRPEVVLDALGLKARVLAEAGRVEEAIAVLGEMVERFEGDPDPALRKQVTIALANKVTALDDLDREDESAEVFQDMLTQFGEEALTMFDGTASHFANASEPQEREGLASALYGKALALEKLDRRDEALSTLTELIARFEDDENENVQDVVSDARETHEGIVDGEGG
jgi:pentatricopeptide repeat protein